MLSGGSTDADTTSGVRLLDQSRAADWRSSITFKPASAASCDSRSCDNQRVSVTPWRRHTEPSAGNIAPASRAACTASTLALALPFAYLHARSGSMSLKIFGGIMLGISFVLINHISSHLGLLQNWQPWLAAAAPSLLYLLLSMSVFAWLVRYQ